MILVYMHPQYCLFPPKVLKTTQNVSYCLTVLQPFKARVYSIGGFEGIVINFFFKYSILIPDIRKHPQTPFKSI